jgi:hypothetical protein
MNEIVDFVGEVLSSAGEEALKSQGGQEAVATITAAAVKAATASAKREVATMVVPAFIAGVLIAKYLQK